MSKVTMIKYNTSDGEIIAKLSLQKGDYIKVGDFEILMEELELHDVPLVDIVVSEEIDNDSNDYVMRVLRDDGKYYFYPLCDLYFE